MYSYKQIFKQAFKVTWQSPSLWFFAFFVALLGGTGELELFLGSYGFSSQGFLVSFWQGLVEGGLFTVAGLQGVGKILFTHPFTLFLILLLFLIILGLSVLIIWLAVVSQTALIARVISISRDKLLNWRSSFELGLARFWPVLGLNILLRLGLLLLLALSVLFLVPTLTFPGSIIFFILIFDFSFLLTLLLSFIIKYAVCAAVLENKPFKESLQVAWRIFTKNWLLSLEIAIILFVIYLAINSLLVWLVSFVLFGFLSVFPGFIFGLLFIFLGLIGIFVGAQIFLTIFHWTVWALVFELLTGPKTLLVSKLQSGFKKIS